MTEKCRVKISQSRLSQLCWDYFFSISAFMIATMMMYIRIGLKLLFLYCLFWVCLIKYSYYYFDFPNC